jgi:DNA-binding Lrp family transcriptional regulator
MSAPAVGERLARLERMGVIQGYTVAVDWALLGYPVVVYLPVVATAGADLGQLILTLGQQPEVEQISVVSGAHDLMVRLRVRDHAHLSEILLNRIWQIPGVQRTETLISLAEMHPKAVAMELLNELEKPHD